MFCEIPIEQLIETVIMFLSVAIYAAECTRINKRNDRFRGHIRLGIANL